MRDRGFEVEFLDPGYYFFESEHSFGSVNWEGDGEYVISIPGRGGLFINYGELAAAVRSIEL